jgi:hypothetical protein
LNAAIDLKADVTVRMEALPFLTKQTVPPEVDHLKINADGTVRLGRAGEVVEFGFTFLNRRFIAGTRTTQSGPILQLSADIAPVPYSAEGIETRRAAMAIISSSQGLKHARLVITKSKQICCIGKIPVRQSWAPVDLISAATRIMLEIQPYLQALLEILPPAGKRRR